jgi:2-polyprenyl-3-methyl-5-hydroxy-6-metoxy-1,4-benzoquinol methylase
MKNDLYIEAYEKLATKRLAGMVTSGRYLTTHWYYKKQLGRDIINKLKLNKHDTVLEIGCNVGIYHKEISKAVKFLDATDAGEAIIKLAKERNHFNNIDYTVLNALQKWPENIEQKIYDKILVYSVIHFFDDIDAVKKLLTSLYKHLNPGGLIMLGEVRTIQKYDAFKELQSAKKNLSLRDIKFIISKKIQSFYVSNLGASLPCISYDRDDLIKACEESGFKVVEHSQQSFHPFYNTCSDFILTKAG